MFHIQHILHHGLGQIGQIMFGKIAQGEFFHSVGNGNSHVPGFRVGRVVGSPILKIQGQIHENHDDGHGQEIKGRMA